jgi:hypothetical protein
MHDAGLLDYEPVLGQLEDVSPAVGQGNVRNFVRVHPDLALPALQHGRGEALL